MTDLLPLSRRRDYNILWLSQLGSELVVELVLVAVPLLVLTRTGSALEMGLTGSALAAATLVAAVPAGIVADRLNRKAVMLCCQAGRLLACGTVLAMLWSGGYSFPLLLAAVLAEGLLGSVFEPAEQSALPQVVPREQLQQALARNAARPFLATLLGPAAAGALFAVHPAAPFTAAFGVLLLSGLALALLRLPPRDPGAPGETEVRGQLAEGLRWVLGNRAIRAPLGWQMCVNLVFNALVVLVLAVSHEDEVAPGELGLMMACLGAGGLLGAALAARLHTVLKPNVIIVAFGWLLTLTVAGMAVSPPGIATGLLLGFAGLLAPVANTAVLTSQTLLTPDHLRGRLAGITGFGGNGAAALGPFAGGLLVTYGGGAETAIALCAFAFAVIAVLTTANRALRRFSFAQE